MAPWPAPTVLLGRPLEALKIKENGTGKKREVVRAHHDEERELRRLETTASRGGRQTPAAVSLRKAERSEDREKENGKGGKKARAHGGFLQLKPRRGGGNVGGAGWARPGGSFQPGESEGVGGGRLEVGGGPDGWTPPVCRQGE